MKKSLNHKEYQKLTKYIRNPQESVRNWRPTESPFIYISFDINQLLASYGSLKNVKVNLAEYGTSTFPPAVLQSLKQLLQKEWIDKAGLPVKFLDINSKAEDIIGKNVCFIVSMQLTETDMRKRSLAPFMDTEVGAFNFGGVVNSYYKIIRVPKINSIVEMNNWVKQAFLHETGHALCELKHFKQYAKDDSEPFSKTLTCMDSVMSYFDTCPPVLKKFFETKNEIIASNAFPIELGPLDLAAANEFREDFQKRHENHAKEVKQLGYDSRLPPEFQKQGNRKELTIMPNKIGYLEAMVNYLEKKALDYAQDLVSTCPSYFNNTTSVYRQNNPMLLFQPAQSALMIGNPVNNLPLPDLNISMV